MKIKSVFVILLLGLLLSSCTIDYDYYNFETGGVTSKGYFNVFLDAGGGFLETNTIVLNTKGNYSLLYSDDFIPKKEGFTFIAWVDSSGNELNKNDNAEHIKKIYAKYFPAPNAKRIGGEIYYVHEDNGAKYKFFDDDGNLIGVNLTDLSELKKATWYSVEGTPEVDRYFVLYTEKYGNLECDTTKLYTTETSDTGLIGRGKALSTQISKNRIGDSSLKNDAYIFLSSLNSKIWSDNNPTSMIPCDWYIGTTGEYMPITDGKESIWYVKLFKDNNVITSSVGYSKERKRNFTMVWYGRENDWRTNEVISTNPFMIDDFLGYCSGYIVPIRSF